MKFSSAIILGATLLLCCGLVHNSYSAAQPLFSEKGRIDLRQWDIERDGPAALHGEWEFYWSRLLTPADFTKKDKPKPDVFITTPGVWNGQKLPDGEVTAHGMATYRLLIDLPPHPGELGLRLEDAGTSMKVFANGNLIHQAGNPGGEYSSTPGSNPGVVFFEPTGDQLELIVQVSNFDHRLGGMWRGFYLGLPRDILNLWSSAVLWAGLLIGSLLIIGIYHLIVFLMSRNDRSFFYFGIFCLLICLRVMVTDDKLLRLLMPDMGWSLMKRIEYLTIFLAWPAFLLFIRNLYPREMQRSVCNIISGLSLALCVFVLAAPPALFSYCTLVFYPLTGLTIIYMIQRLWVAMRHRRDGARALLWGFGVLSTLAIYDILVAQTVIRSFYLLPLGLVAFIFAQAAMLSYRNKVAFQTLERQRADLAEKNLAIEHENRQRMNAEQALRNSERRFRNLADLLPEPVLETDVNGTVTYANRSSFEVFGYKRAKETEAVNVFDTVHGPYKDKVIKAMRELRQGRYLNGLETMVRRADGTMVSIALYANAIVNDGNTEGFRAIILDITERKKLELQLRQAQSLETVGTLAGGVAHDFNNILQAVRGYVHLVRQRNIHDTQIMHYLEMIEEESRRAADLTSRLLTFSRQVEPEMEPIDLNREVDRVVRLLRRTIPRMIQVDKEIDERLWPVMADSTQIGQILLNLGSNAADAMPDGGRLLVRTENAELDEEFCNANIAAEPGPYCKISVIDTGHGMDEKVLKHIFEPFYTSKRTGKGTGLGLAMVYGIVQAHKGIITVQSHPGWGTTFEIYLPASPGLRANAPVREAVDTSADGRGRTILLVDDEELILESTSEFLEQCGFKVLCAGQGESAIELYDEHGGRISLIVMDLNMPGKGGGWAIGKLREQGATLPILVVSGDLSAQPETNAALGSEGHRLSKPYSLPELLNRICQILDEA